MGTFGWQGAKSAIPKDTVAAVAWLLGHRYRKFNRLEDARSFFQTALETDGPEGEIAQDQRSCMIVPLLAEKLLLGYLYADIDGAFGRFGDDDRDLLALLAAHSAVALENAQRAVDLERRVEGRTRELGVSLEHQGATADILKVIASSHSDLQPVFDAIVDAALRVVTGTRAFLLRLDGPTHRRLVAAAPKLDVDVQTTMFSPQPIDPAGHFPSRVLESKEVLRVVQVIVRIKSGLTISLRY